MYFFVKAKVGVKNELNVENKFLNIHHADSRIFFHVMVFFTPFVTRFLNA